MTLYARVLDGCRSLEYFHLSGVRLYRAPRVPLAFDTVTPCPFVSHVWIEGHPVEPTVMRRVFPNVAYLQLDAMPGFYSVAHVRNIISSWRTLRVLVISLRNSNTFPSILACASLPHLVVLSFEASMDEQNLRADDRLAFMTPNDIEKVKANLVAFYLLIPIYRQVVHHGGFPLALTHLSVNLVPNRNDERMDDIEDHQSSAKLLAAMLGSYMTNLRTVSMFEPVETTSGGLKSRRVWLIHDQKNLPGNRWSRATSDLYAWPNSFDVNSI